MTVPPVPAEIIIRKYALFTLAPMLTGTVPDDELPELNTPLVTSGVNWVKLPALLPPAQRNTWNDWRSLIGGEVPESFHANCNN